MALVHYIFVALLKCSWSLSSDIEEFTNDANYTSQIRKGRCLARCYEQYGKKPNQSIQDTLYNVYQSNDCTGYQCKACIIPCLAMNNTVTESCKNISITHGEICMNSSLILIGNWNSTTDNVYKGINISTPKMTCQHIKGHKSVTLFLHWHIQLSHETSAVFVVSMVKGRNSTTWKTLGQIGRSVVPIHNLLFDTEYIFKVTVVSTDGIVDSPKNSDWITTMRANSIVNSPKDIEIAGQKVHNGMISALLKWNVGTDPPCYFILHWMTNNPQHSEYNRDELQAPPMPKYWINNLHFGSNYTLHMNSYGTPDFNGGSSKLVTWFITAECLEATNYNYSLCAPDAPRNVTGDVVNSPDNDNSSSCLVNVSWSPPLYTDSNNEVSSYLVKWYKVIPIHLSKFIEPHQMLKGVSGDKNWIEITDIQWEYNYSISVQAVSSKGQSKAVVLFLLHEDCPQAMAMKYTELVDGSNHLSLILGGSAGILVIIIVLSLSIVLRVKRQKRSNYHASEGREEELNPLYCHGTDYVTHLAADDSYEIEFSCLTLLDVLGEGAFGKVYKARFNDPKVSPDKDLIVAVKMLKDLHGNHEKKSLLMEIEFMKQLGSHPHIVSFIGCCKKESVCLLMDYCRLGDLRSFLLRYRQRQQKDYRTCRLQFDGDSGLNSSADSTCSCKSQPPSEIHQTRLLSYARQIVLAMEYMSSKKFIHRDLAARNILMCDEERLKVSDFGLTRDIYERNLYQPTSARRLPYKWMALEAIFDQVFTIKSDVWSFGIVLWEIVTLGGSPYPGIPNKDLFNLLKEGYRMEKPENCSLEIYQLMLSVWHPNPYCRPSFTELRKKLEAMLEQSKPYINLSINISKDYYETSSFSDNSDRGSLNTNDNDQTAYVEMSTKNSILTYETPCNG